MVGGVVFGLTIVIIALSVFIAIRRKRHKSFSVAAAKNGKSRTKSKPTKFLFLRALFFGFRDGDGIVYEKDDAQDNSAELSSENRFEMGGGEEERNRFEMGGGGGGNRFEMGGGGDGNRFEMGGDESMSHELDATNERKRY